MIGMANYKKWSRLFLLLLPWVAGVGEARADASVPELMRKVEQVVEIRDTMHHERVAWDAQKQSMEHGLRLLQREKELLEERIAEWTDTADEQSDERVTLEQQRTKQESAFQGADRSLDAHQAFLAQARKFFPEHFEGAPGATLSERLGYIFGSANRVQRDHGRIAHTRQLMDIPDSGRRQMDVLKLGHAQAYAVSPDDRLAGHGVWTGTEWVWTWDAAWAPVIREAVRIHQGELAPRWTFLPVTMLGQEGP